MDRDLIQARRAVRRNRCGAGPDRFPRPSTGYPRSMSNSDSDTDAPTPPGGPQRQDAPGRA